MTIDSIGVMSNVEAPTITYIPFGDRTFNDGWRIDGSKVQFWAFKKDAVLGAKAIGWRVDDVVKVQTRFCGGWALCDGRFGLVSKDSYIAAVERRRG
jgi:hypothetical protein